MFYLIMKHVQNSSEAAVEHLRTEIKNLKISKVPDKNVDTVVTVA